MANTETAAEKKKRLAAEAAADEDDSEEDDEEDDAPVAKKGKKEKFKGFEVGDPMELRPKELPLVITPNKEGWANDAQAEFAAILNGYAYRNPVKWAAKKAALLAQLEALAENPGKLSQFKGTAADGGKLSFKDKRFQE